MAFVLSDRVKEVTSTTGTSDMVLGGAVGAATSFASTVGDGNQTYYCVETADGNYETGVGTYTLGTNTLSRDTVISSSNSGSKITLTGVSEVFCAQPGPKAVFTNPEGLVSGVYANFQGFAFPDGTVQYTSAASGKAPVTLERQDAGIFFNYFVNNAYDETVSLHLEDEQYPKWKMGLRDSATGNSAPTYGYIFAEQGYAGGVADSTSEFYIASNNGFWVKHNSQNIANFAQDDGIIFQNISSASPTFTVKGAAAQAKNLQNWNNSSSTTLAKVTKDGHVSGVELHTPKILFGDGTIQTTAVGVASGDNVSIFTNDAGYLTAHPNIAAASSSDNATNVFIQDITVDSNGHITAIGTASAFEDWNINSDDGVPYAISDGNTLQLVGGTNVTTSYNNSTKVLTITSTDTDTNTTYTAGDGLVLSSTEFSAPDIETASGALRQDITTNTSNIALKANIASPTFTGTPAAPTASVSTNTTQVATTAFVAAEVAALGLGALATLGSVAAGQIDANAVDSSELKDGSIDASHLAPDVISGLVDVTSEDADYLLLWDATDSALKRVDAGEFRGGGGGAGDMTGVDLTAGAGITIDGETNTTSGDYSATITCTVTDTNTQLTEDQVDDYVAGLLTAGSNVSLVYDDSAGTLTVAATDTNTQLTQEQVEDYVNGVLTAGSNVSLTYDDAAGTLTVASTDTVYTLPEANATTKGGIELFSNTDQSVAATAVSTTAARTYGLQLNSDGQGVVNVPWVDTNTTYSVTDGELSQNNFTNADHTKLDGIDASANNYTLPSASLTAVGGVELATTGETTTGTDATRAVTPAGVQAAIDALVGGAPGALDTLNELAAAINDDASYASTITTALALKSTIASPTFTGTVAIPNVANLETAVVANTAKVTNVSTNLSATANGTSLTVESSDGNNVALPAATTSAWGIMSDDQATKLDGIETSADVTDATNVTAAGALMDSELAGIAAVKATTGTFLSADESKLDAIEASADVTDATNVTAAGALMDSELAGLAAVKATTGTFLTADQTKLDGIATSATADQTAGEILTLLEDGIDSVHYKDGSIDEAHLNVTNSPTDNYLLSYDSGSTGFTWIAAAGGGSMSSFIITDGSTPQTVDDGETITFTDGVGAEFVTSATNTVTVNSVDSEIVHDNLSGFVANEHLDWTTNVGTIHAGNYTNTTYSVGDGGLTQINFTSADNSKLDGIEASADVTDTTNVTAAGALMDSECAGLAALKLTTGTFLTADQSKLDAIEASADVTDATNVTAAGALMDSEVTNLATVKALATGISNGNFLTANAAVADNDFLRIDGTAVEGRTASEVLSDIAAAPAAGNSSIVTVGTIGAGTWQGTAIASSYVATLNQNTTGTAATVTTAAQPNITSVGTLTTLTVDSIIINGTTIGHTSDTDAIAISSGGNVTFSKATKPSLKANSDGATITFDVNEANVHTVTLGDNRTLAILNETAGQKFMLRLQQDATGSRTVTWFSTIKWAGGSAPTLTTTAGKADVFGFLVTGTDTYDGFVIGQNI